MATVVKTTFQLRRGRLEEWESKNPVLALGEPGFAYDKFELRIGDGVTAWKDLPSIAGNELTLSPDGTSLAYNNKGDLEVIGFSSASVNQVPVKNDKGELIWTSLAPVAFSGDISDLTQKEAIHIYCGSAVDLIEE